MGATDALKPNTDRKKSDTVTGQMIKMEEIREAIGKLQRLAEQFEKEQEMSVNSSKILKIKNVLTNYPVSISLSFPNFI